MERASRENAMLVALCGLSFLMGEAILGSRLSGKLGCLWDEWVLTNALYIFNNGGVGILIASQLWLGT
ncbi:hypothetical protein IAD21_06159 [Abditibacteriota bacterium]|nr:hypothetical protein IAD21_06159 [Abditibacteriota bacterium]